MGMNNGYPFATKAQIAERIRTDSIYRAKCVAVLLSLGIKAPDDVDGWDVARYSRRLARYFRDADLKAGMAADVVEKAKQYGVVPGMKPDPKGTFRASRTAKAKPGPTGSLPDLILGACSAKGLTMTHIAKALPDANPADITISVAKLVQAGALKKTGRGPGTRYQVAA
jgi:hypothetical protein